MDHWLLTRSSCVPFSTSCNAGGLKGRVYKNDWHFLAFPSLYSLSHCLNIFCMLMFRIISSDSSPNIWLVKVLDNYRNGSCGCISSWRLIRSRSKWGPGSTALRNSRSQIGTKRKFPVIQNAHCLHWISHYSVCVFILSNRSNEIQPL